MFSHHYRSPPPESPIVPLFSSSSRPANSEAAAALLSLKQPVVHQQVLGLPPQTLLSPIPECLTGKEDKTDKDSGKRLQDDSGLDLNSSIGSHGTSSPESVSSKTDQPAMLFAQAPPSHPYWAYHTNGFPAACLQPVGGFACVRGRMRPNSCHICGKSYARASTLRTHMRTHNGEKPYQCSLCFKSFTQAANLSAHMRTHSGEKPFKCPLCDRRFSQSSSVTTHMRTHSGERPYKCSICSKAFADSSTLTKHFRTHSGEKPYQCHICDAMFSQSGNLNRHMKTHRNIHF